MYAAFFEPQNHVRSLPGLDRVGRRVVECAVDNSAYRSRQWAEWCSGRGIRHLRTRPCRTRTNGKAERFIQMMLREWAYACSYDSSDHRRRALGPWIDYYNERRPRGSLGKRTPASRLAAG
jgi:transposase InsO family protein